MKKQFFLLGAVAIFSFAACNNNGSDTTTTTDSTANANTTATTATSTGPTTGTEIANFSSRSFVDLKTKKPIKLKWDAEKHYYTDESGNQPYYYYDPASHDTFDYWGRRLNNYLTYSNGDYTIDESRMSSSDMSTTTTADTSTTSGATGGSGNMKIKAKDDKYKEKTDSSKLKVTDKNMKVKSK
jgi:hypothetical protein